MIYLIGSILASSYLTLSFKVVERLRLNTFQVIVFNYFACVITGSLLNGKQPITAATVHQPWFIWSLVLGFSFITLFNLIGFTAQKLGVSVAAVASKLSLVIPFLFSIYLYNETAGLWKIAGILVALVSVVLTCWPKTQESTAKRNTPLLLLLTPLVLFLGSGLFDSLIKYVEQGYLDGTNNNDFLITSFAVAGLLGFFFLCLQWLAKKQVFQGKAVLMGIAIGVPNYFSIWFLVKVLKQFGANSSAIIPINNMGIVLVSTVLAAVLFHEKLSRINIIGVGLALAAIALIAFG
jgi:drug/metabolite transporter (DMT)-like permease